MGLGRDRHGKGRDGTRDRTGRGDRIGVGGAPGPGTPTGRDISGRGRDGIESGPDCSRGVGRQSPITNLRRVRRSGHNRANGADGGQDRLLGQRSRTPPLRLSRPLGASRGDLGIAGSWACGALRPRREMSRPVGPAERLLRTPKKSESLGVVLSQRLPCSRAAEGALPPNVDRYHPAIPIRPTRHRLCSRPLRGGQIQSGSGSIGGSGRCYSDARR
jgi:hypothetical protein